MKQPKKIIVGMGVVIMRRGRILLGKRIKHKTGSYLEGFDTWSLPGGKVTFGETMEQATIREVKEETGILIKKLQLISLKTYIAGTTHSVTAGYLARGWSGQPKTREPHVIAGWQWFPLDALPRPLYWLSADVIKELQRGKS